jgi:hypothetical protein
MPQTSPTDNADKENSAPVVSVISVKEFKSNVKVTRDHVVALLGVAPDGLAESDRNDAISKRQQKVTKMKSTIRSLANEHLHDRLGRAAKRLGLTFPNGQLVLTAADINKCTKACSLDQAFDRLDMFAHIFFLQFEMDPGWELKLEQTIMEALKIKYSEMDGLSASFGKKGIKGCVAKIISDARNEIIKNFRDAPHGLVLMVSRKKDEITLKSKNRKRPKGTYIVKRRLANEKDPVRYDPTPEVSFVCNRNVSHSLVPNNSCGLMSSRWQN